MNNITVFSFAIADYKIANITVDIYFSSAVLDAYFTKEALLDLIRERKEHTKIMDGIFQIIKERVETYRTYEIWYDLIEYDGIELIWKSRYTEEKNIMYVEVMRVKENISMSLH